MAEPDIRGVYRKPFNEQVAFFRNKLGNLVPTRRWDDMLGEAHDTGFMVAGAMQAELLSDLAAAVDKAITEGTGLDAFRKDFEAIARRNGWTGWTGEGSRKGVGWRAKTIYRTNLFTSYSAGRYAQLVQGNFPLWVYFHGASQEPRPEHLSWNGIALPPDHEFWRTHYPPSDWGCSCYVVGARSAAGVRRLGGDPDKKLPANWRTLDQATGEPLGIGRGWGYAPGARVSALVSAIAGQVRHWDYSVAKAFMGELSAAQADALSTSYRALPSVADDVRRYAQRVFEPKPDLPPLPPVKTLGLIPARDVEADGAGQLRGHDLSVTEVEIRHIIAQHGDDAKEARRGQRAVTAADFATLPQLIDSVPGRFDGLSRTGRPTIVYSAMIDGQRHEAVFETRSGRRTATLLSYRIGRKLIDGPPA